MFNHVHKGVFQLRTKPLSQLQGQPSDKLSKLQEIFASNKRKDKRPLATVIMLPL
jgi:hypothetical protein